MFTSNRNMHHQLMEGTTSLSYTFFPGQMPILAGHRLDLNLVINPVIDGNDIYNADSVVQNGSEIKITFPNNLRIKNSSEPVSANYSIQLSEPPPKDEDINPGILYVYYKGGKYYYRARAFENLTAEIPETEIASDDIKNPNEEVESILFVIEHKNDLTVSQKNKLSDILKQEIRSKHNIDIIYKKYIAKKSYIDPHNNSMIITFKAIDGMDKITISDLSTICIHFESTDGPYKSEYSSIKVEEKFNGQDGTINIAYVPIAVAPAALTTIEAKSAHVKDLRADGAIEAKSMHATDSLATHNLLRAKFAMFGNGWNDKVGTEEFKDLYNDHPSWRFLDNSNGITSAVTPKLPRK